VIKIISLRRPFPLHFAALQPHRVARFGGVCDTARLCPSTSTHGVARGRNVSIGNARVVISALDPSGAHPVAHDGNERTSYSRVGCVTAARGPWVPIRALRARAGLCLCVYVLTCACCVCVCVYVGVRRQPQPVHPGRVQLGSHLHYGSVGRQAVVATLCEQRYHTDMQAHCNGAPFFWRGGHIPQQYRPCNGARACGVVLAVAW